MENMNLAALLLTGLLSGLAPADEKGQEHNIQPPPAQEQQQLADRRRLTAPASPLEAPIATLTASATDAAPR